jgi:hypothetical protein
MSRCIDKIQLINITIGTLVRYGDCLTLDGNAAFPFNIHAVEELVLEFPAVYHLGLLNKAIREGGFTVIDMGYDAEIA